MIKFILLSKFYFVIANLALIAVTEELNNKVPECPYDHGDATMRYFKEYSVL